MARLPQTAKIAERLDRALKAAGVDIVGVSIGSIDRASWTVHPAHLQSAAQPIIDAFDPDDPIFEETADEIGPYDDGIAAIIKALLQNWAGIQSEIATNGKVRVGVWTTKIKASLKKNG